MEGNHPDHDADDHGYQNAYAAGRGTSNPRDVVLALANERASPLEEDDVPPDAVELPQPLADADGAKPARVVEREARLVLREHRRLDGPDPQPFAVREEALEEEPADAVTPRARRDVDAVLGDARVHGPR
jgi:hypothetical protein